MVTLRRRIANSEAAKQEAESQSNQRRTRFPRTQATSLTDTGTLQSQEEKAIKGKEEDESDVEVIFP